MRTVLAASHQDPDRVVDRPSRPHGLTQALGEMAGTPAHERARQDDRRQGDDGLELVGALQVKGGRAPGVQVEDSDRLVVSHDWKRQGGPDSVRSSCATELRPRSLFAGCVYAANPPVTKGIEAGATSAHVLGLVDLTRGGLCGDTGADFALDQQCDPGHVRGAVAARAVHDP